MQIVYYIFEIVIVVEWMMMQGWIWFGGRMEGQLFFLFGGIWWIHGSLLNSMALNYL